MARGPLAAAGGLYEADMVANAVRSAGGGIEEAGDSLDFGCSSGRVLRVLTAAYPALHWSGCDPNERAIEWASESLREAQFFVNPQAPPMPMSEGSLGLVYAISIWSHFAPELGLRWFDEMHRVLRPGGLLVFTSHGEQSISFYVERGMRSVEQAASILQALYRRGWWYAAEFGHAGDAGVINPDWGTAFITPEWVLSKLCPRWRVVEYAPGRNQLNQDVYVLQRP
jgi:SAM-dependent methyltransferase